MIYQQHETYGYDDNKVDVIFKCKDHDRLDRFSFYLSIGLSLCQHDDLLMELIGRLETGGAGNE